VLEPFVVASMTKDVPTTTWQVTVIATGGAGILMTIVGYLLSRLRDLSAALLDGWLFVLAALCFLWGGFRMSFEVGEIMATAWAAIGVVGVAIGRRHILTIEEALYWGVGQTKGNGAKDVTGMVRSKVQNGKLALRVDNDTLGGDPSPLAEKWLTLTYKRPGEIKAHVGHWRVGESVTL
jgi:hypothetical protein